MRVMALDHGAARTGVAVSDATGTLATPADRRRAGRRRRRLRAAPRSSSPSSARDDRRRPSRLARWARARAGGEGARVRAPARRRHADVPVVTYDERFTTKVAAQRGGRAPVDARGAAVILEDYLRARRRAPRRRTRGGTMADDADCRRRAAAVRPTRPTDLPPDDWAPIERGPVSERRRRGATRAAAAGRGRSGRQRRRARPGRRGRRGARRSPPPGRRRLLVADRPRRPGDPRRRIGVGAVRAYLAPGRDRRQGQGDDPRGLVAQGDRRDPRREGSRRARQPLRLQGQGRRPRGRPQAGHLPAARERAVRRPRRAAARRAWRRRPST